VILPSGRSTGFLDSASLHSNDGDFSATLHLNQWLCRKSVHLFGPAFGRSLQSQQSPQHLPSGDDSPTQIAAATNSSGSGLHRAIIENALFDAFLHEQLVVRVREPMGLVANALKQPQSRRIHWKSQRQRPARPIDLLRVLLPGR